MVHIHTQSDLTISSSMPRAAMRRNFRGSILSSPVAGHPAEHAPQVKQAFKLPPSGSNFLTLSRKILFCFLFPSLMTSTAIGHSFLL